MAFSMKSKQVQQTMEFNEEWCLGLGPHVPIPLCIFQIPDAFLSCHPTNHVKACRRGY